MGKKAPKAPKAPAQADQPYQERFPDINFLDVEAQDVVGMVKDGDLQVADVRKIVKDMVAGGKVEEAYKLVNNMEDGDTRLLKTYQAVELNQIIKQARASVEEEVPTQDQPDRPGASSESKKPVLQRYKTRQIANMDDESLKRKREREEITSDEEGLLRTTREELKLLPVPELGPKKALTPQDLTKFERLEAVKFPEARGAGSNNAPDIFALTPKEWMQIFLRCRMHKASFLHKSRDEPPSHNIFQPPNSSMSFCWTDIQIADRYHVEVTQEENLKDSIVMNSVEVLAKITTPFISAAAELETENNRRTLIKDKKIYEVSKYSTQVGIFDLSDHIDIQVGEEEDVKPKIIVDKGFIKEVEDAVEQAMKVMEDGGHGGMSFFKCLEEQVFKKYGEVYPLRVRVGLAMYKAEERVADSNQTREDTKKNMQAKLEAKFPFCGGGAGAGHASIDSTETLRESSTGAQNWHTIGGATGDPTDLTSISKHRADPKAWRVIEEDQFKSVLHFLPACLQDQIKILEDDYKQHMAQIKKKSLEKQIELVKPADMSEDDFNKFEKCLEDVREYMTRKGTDAHLVVLFGQVGIGKSCLVNQLKSDEEKKVPKISNEPGGTTKVSGWYQCDVDGLEYIAVDPVGVGDSSVHSEFVLQMFQQLARTNQVNCILMVHKFGDPFNDTSKFLGEIFERGISENRNHLIMAATQVDLIDGKEDTDKWMNSAQHIFRKYYKHKVDVVPTSIHREETIKTLKSAIKKTFTKSIGYQVVDAVGVRDIICKVNGVENVESQLLDKIHDLEEMIFKNKIKEEKEALSPYCISSASCSPPPSPPTPDYADDIGLWNPHGN